MPTRPLTTEPNELTVSINHDRMPVLLSEPSQFDTWLNGSPEEAPHLTPGRLRGERLPSACNVAIAAACALLVSTGSDDLSRAASVTAVLDG